MADENHFQITHDGDVTVIRFETSPPANVALPWADPLVEFVEQQQPKKLLLDFEAVTRFPSATIEALLRVDKRVRAYSGQMRLCGMCREVREVFKITRLDENVFQIFDSCRSARRSFTGPQIHKAPS
jgi:anti-anti-sigma factor